MKRSFEFIVALATAFLMAAFPAYAGPSKKPLPPLRISIAPVQPGITSDQIKPGDIIEFKVIALSSIDVPEMSIKVELVGGAKLVSGDMSWSGPAVKNEAKSITLTVQAPEQGKGMIKARVSLPPSDSTRFSAQTEFRLGPETKTKSAQEPVIKKDRKGRSIIEYR